MTTNELSRYIGETGYITVGIGDSMRVHVRVVDVKERWGRVRFLVTPVAGDGGTWTEEVHF